MTTLHLTELIVKQPDKINLLIYELSKLTRVFCRTLFAVCCYRQLWKI
jgi:hypothetical protein